jgi:hypothetical protein
MTCFAIYWQKARTKSKDIGGSDLLTAVCVCQRVNIIVLYVMEEWLESCFIFWKFYKIIFTRRPVSLTAFFCSFTQFLSLNGAWLFPFHILSPLSYTLFNWQCDLITFLYKNLLSSHSLSFHCQVLWSSILQDLNRHLCSSNSLPEVEPRFITVFEEYSAWYPEPDKSRPL